ncbi:MAG: ATP F0F1 synthase subunit B [Alphaproteobacteria bacterium]|nr:ATP F0F1 synthase subunit B [Alphaproteobacteria bacterium]
MAAAPETSEAAAHAGDAAHDAAGAAHGGEHAAVAFPPFDASLFASQLFWFAITFGALYIFVSRFVLPKVGAVLENRATTLKADLDLAHRESEAAERARLEAERTHADARANARKLIDEMRADAQAELNAAREKADDELNAKIAAEEGRIAARRDQALKEIGAVADEVAGEIVAKLVGRAPKAAAAKKVTA